MDPIRPLELNDRNQGTIIIPNQEAARLKTGDTYNINGIDVTVLMVIQLDSRSSSITYYLPPDTRDED